MGIRDRLGVARDTMAEAVFNATEKVVRCTAKKDGRQCQLSKGKPHKGKRHEHGSGKNAVRW